MRTLATVTAADMPSLPLPSDGPAGALDFVAVVVPCDGTRSPLTGRCYGETVVFYDGRFARASPSADDRSMGFTEHGQHVAGYFVSTLQESRGVDGRYRGSALALRLGSPRLTIDRHNMATVMLWLDRLAPCDCATR